MGIAAAAQALDLDFIPLFKERYDLVIPREYYQSDLLAPVLDIIKEGSFRQAIAELPGYDTDPMGTIIAEINTENSL